MDHSNKIKQPMVGVALDHPLGEHDGSVGDHRYFRCREKHGVLVRPATVDVLPLQHAWGAEYGQVQDLGVAEDAGEQVCTVW